MTTVPAELYTFASGSVGTVVHSRNAHGQYTRPRTTPIDPNTLRQQRFRARWATINAMWAGTLGHSDRLLWNEYARIRVHKREDGRKVQLSGQQWFVRTNQSRQLPALGTILVPPTTLAMPLWTLPTATSLLAVGQISIFFNPADAWANEATGAMIVSVGPNRPVSHTFFAGPWRRSGIIRGTTPVPPISPRNLTDPFAPTATANRWFRAYTIRADGRISTVATGPIS